MCSMICSSLYPPRWSDAIRRQKPSADCSTCCSMIVRPSSAGSSIWGAGVRVWCPCRPRELRLVLSWCHSVGCNPVTPRGTSHSSSQPQLSTAIQDTAVLPPPPRYLPVNGTEYLGTLYHRVFDVTIPQDIPAPAQTRDAALPSSRREFVCRNCCMPGAIGPPDRSGSARRARCAVGQRPGCMLLKSK